MPARALRPARARLAFAVARCLLASALLALSVLAAGCGVGPGEERGGAAELRVTRDFGRTRLATERLDPVREGDTVLRFLQSERKVETRFGGGFVHSIDGLSGGGTGGTHDWFYFVNGIEADVGAAEYELFPGDVVTWDHRYWRAAMSVPVIVGAFPEPFAHGRGGKRLPVRIECSDGGDVACDRVAGRLEEIGVPVTRAVLGSPGGADVVRVMVAPWSAARRATSARVLEEGPEASGVFARFTEEGRRLELLDERGETAGSAPPGSGLVAATSFADRGVLYLVTGTDEAGVERAADALDAGTLKDAFAVAVTPAGPVELPVDEEGGA